MAQDKQLTRIEAKLNALLEAQEIDPAEFGESQAKRAAAAPRELTPEQKEAIANAPKVIPAVPRNANAPANVAPPAPSDPGETPPSVSVPPSAVGSVTTETVQTTPAGGNSGANGLADLGLTADQQTSLRLAGYVDRAALVAATDDDLIAVPMIGKATVANLRTKLK